MTPGCRFLKVECASHEGIQNKWYFFGNRATGQPGNRATGQPGNRATGQPAKAAIHRRPFHLIPLFVSPGRHGGDPAKPLFYPSRGGGASKRRSFCPPDTALPAQSAFITPTRRRLPQMAAGLPRRHSGRPLKPLCPPRRRGGRPKQLSFCPEPPLFADFRWFISREGCEGKRLFPLAFFAAFARPTK